MLRRIYIALLWVPLVLPHGIRAQTDTATWETSVAGYEDIPVGESRDVPCEYSLSPRNFEHYGVEFEGYMFLSEWRSKRSDFPLPSWNWYYALPNRNPISSDGKARWDNAEIQVHCWVYRAMYIIRHHRHHVASAGQLVELCEGGTRTNFRHEDGYDDGDGSRLGSSRYDPYAVSWGATEFCADDNDGGGGGAGGTQYYPGDYTNGETVGWSDGVGTGGYSACGQHAKVEYVCIDVWVEGVGWTEWSCGYATTC